MATANTPSLDCCVVSYVKNWEVDVIQKLQSTKVKLISSTPRQRAQLKTTVETLSAVLDLLQGRRISQEKYTCDTVELRLEALKMKLMAAEGKEQAAADSLRAQKKINRDFKLQLERGNLKRLQTVQAAERTSQDLHRQLKEVQVKSASRLSLETAINMDLSSKLEEIHQQMQRPPSQRSTESPADLREVLPQLNKSTRELEVPASSIQTHEQQDEEDKEVPQFGMEELKSEVDEEVELLEKEEEKVVCIKMSHFQKIVDDAVSDIWEEQQATLKCQRVEIEKLQTAVRLAEEQLEVQRQESAKVLQKKEQERAERFEELENSFKEANNRRPRRRNWFVRMFSCGSGRGVE